VSLRIFFKDYWLVLWRELGGSRGGSLGPFKFIVFLIMTNEILINPSIVFLKAPQNHPL
jgi:hypothetical protein